MRRGEIALDRASRAFDIADVDAVSAFADEVHAQHGPVDVVMNVAGIAVSRSIARAYFLAMRCSSGRNCAARSIHRPKYAAS